MSVINNKKKPTQAYKSEMSRLREGKNTLESFKKENHITGCNEVLWIFRNLCSKRKKVSENSFNKQKSENKTQAL